MGKVTVVTPTEAQVRDMQACPVWEKEESAFPWEYDAEETCYLLEGEVEVRTESGEVVTFGAGDLVTFPKGLKCDWEIRKAVRKHYRFA